MALVYLILGTLLGLVAGVFVGVSTGSVFQGFMVWCSAGTLTVFVTAAVVYLRSEPDSESTRDRMIPAE